VGDHIVHRLNAGRELHVEQQFRRSEPMDGQDATSDLRKRTGKVSTGLTERRLRKRYIGADTELQGSRVAASFPPHPFEAFKHLSEAGDCR